MSLIPYLHQEFRRLHGEINGAVRDLTPDQLHWRPGEGCNHIAWSIWHYSRTEDNVVQFVLQRKPTVWMEEGWDEKFGLDSKAQGTGMSPEEAAALRLPSAEAFFPYMDAVWRRTEDYVEALTEAELERVTRIRPQGERTVLTILSENLLTHGFSHLGELWVLRGLQGLTGATF